MDNVISIRGQKLHKVEFGPFQLGSEVPLTFQQIASGEEDIWKHVGLIIDAPALGNDFERVRRYVLAYMKFESGCCGVFWDIGPETIASRIFMDDQPRFLMWTDDL